MFTKFQRPETPPPAGNNKQFTPFVIQLIIILIAVPIPTKVEVHTEIERVKILQERKKIQDEAHMKEIQRIQRDIVIAKELLVFFTLSFSFCTYFNLEYPIR